MKFSPDMYRREVFASKISGQRGIKNVRVLNDGVYLESKRGNYFDKGIMPDAAIKQWIEDMWPTTNGEGGEDNE